VTKSHGRVSLGVVQTRQLLVRFSKIGLELNRLRVRRNRAGAIAALFQQASQVEIPQRLFGPILDGKSIADFCLIESIPEMKQQAKIQVRVDKGWIDLDGFLISMAGFFRRILFQFLGPFVPLLRQGAGLLTWPRQRSNLCKPIDVGRVKVQEELAGIGLPLPGRIPHDHPMSIGKDFDARKHLIIRQLPLQRRENFPNSPHGNSRFQQSLGRSNDQQIVKRKMMGLSGDRCRIGGGAQAVPKGLRGEMQNPEDLIRRIGRNHFLPA